MRLIHLGTTQQLHGKQPSKNDEHLMRFNNWGKRTHTLKVPHHEQGLKPSNGCTALILANGL